MAIYVYGFVTLVVYRTANGEAMFDHSALGPTDWLVLLEFTLMGIVTAYFLKHLGCVWREVGQGTIFIGCASVDTFAFGVAFSGGMMAVVSG